MFTIPTLQSPLEPIACWSGAFTDEEINEIINIGDMLEFQNATLGGETDTDITIRNSKVSWIHPNEKTSWIFNKVVEIISRVNRDKFQFDLSHICEFQYTTYSEGGFYTWHTDADHEEKYGSEFRKLGVSIMLSNPLEDFSGGEFQIVPRGNLEDINSTKLKRGDVLIFPSFIPHQVTKVTSGKRKSLVCWVLGPKFK